MPGSQAQGIQKAPAASSFFWPLSIACPVGIGNQAQDPTIIFEVRQPRCQVSWPPRNLSAAIEFGRKTATPVARARRTLPQAQVREADRRALAKAVT